MWLQSTFRGSIDQFRVLKLADAFHSGPLVFGPRIKELPNLVGVDLNRFWSCSEEGRWDGKEHRAG